MLTERQKKQYSEYLLFRSFYTGFEPTPQERSTLINIDSVDGIVSYLKERLRDLSSPGILLSSGMDSASLLPYMPKGTRAYTIVHKGDDRSEVNVAAEYCARYGVDHKVVVIDPEEYMGVMEDLVISKRMPLSPAEPIFYIAALAAAKDGCEDLVTGGGADTKLGGFPRFREDCPPHRYVDLLAKKYHKPNAVLREYSDCSHVFDNYLVKKGPVGFKRLVVDSRAFLREIGIERFAFNNAIGQAGCRHVAPFSEFIYDFDEKKNKQFPKYVIASLYKMSYGRQPPKKMGMHKPPALLEWFVPKSDIFRSLNLSKMSYPQRFLIYSLDMYHDLAMRGRL